MTTAEDSNSLVEREFLRLLPAEAAAELELLKAEEAAAILVRNASPQAREVWEKMSPAVTQRCLAELPTGTAAEILAGIDPTRAASVLGGMPESVRESVMAALPAARRDMLEMIMSFPPGSAGAMMDPRVWYLRRGSKVGEAIERVREVSHASSSSGSGRRLFYLVDEQARLDGIVELQDLIFARPDDVLGQYARPVPAWADVTLGSDEVIELIDKHGLSSLPVVDGDGHLVGVVRHDTLLAATRAEASVDLQTIFGVSKEEGALSSPLFAIRKRLPWLHINLVTAFLAAAVVGVFESTIASYTALAVLLPVVAGQSGNTGAQALAVVIRGLALREIDISHWRKVLVKEFFAALANGVAVAVTSSLGVYVWSRSLGLTAITGLSMVLSMVVAGLAGAGIPIVLTKLKQDPAQSSSIVLTTITDVAGFFSFLGIATVLLHTL